jgi:cell division protein FtsL
VSAHGLDGPRVTSVRPARPDGEADVQPDLRIVAPPGPDPFHRRRRFRLAVVGAAAFVAVVVFGLVGMHVMLAQNQFRLDRLNARAAVEEARYQRLRLQVDQLESPQRIVATAEGRLGMAAPAGVTYLTPSTPVTLPAGSAGQAAVGPPGPAIPALPSAGTGPKDWLAVKPQLAAHP